MICAPPPPPPPPPPMGISTGLFGTNGYPNPLTFPGIWQWVIGGVGVTSSAGIASAWADQSGLGHSYTTTSHGPTVATAVGGYAALESTAGTQFLQTATPPQQPTTFASCSLFAVVQPISGSQIAFGRIVEMDYNNSFYLGLDTTATHYQFIMNDPSEGSVTGGTVTAAANTLVTATFASAGASGTGTLQVNGTTVSSGTFTTPTSVTPEPVNLLTYYGSVGTNGFKGYVLEMAICTSALSGATLTNANRYFGAKYHITVP